MANKDNPCTAQGCTDLIGRHGAKGFCPYHYRRYAKYGNPLHETPKPNQGKCAVDDCTKDAYRKEYCYAHYMKAWRYGTPTPQHEPAWTDLRGQRFGTLTVTEHRDGRFWVCACDCGEYARRTTNALTQYGDASTCATPGKHYYSAEPGYTAAHDRVKRLHGSASEHRCIQCDSQAYHWSYDHMDPDELEYEYAPGKLIAYSAKVEHYHPRCVPCHKRYDLDRIDSAMRIVA